MKSPGAPQSLRHVWGSTTAARIAALRVVWILVFSLAGAAIAHEVRPAYLELTERAPREFDVFWKVPALGGVPLAGEEMPHERPAMAVEAISGPRTMPCGCPAPTAAQLSRGVLPIHPSLPADAQMLAPPRVERLQGAELRRWTIRTGPHGLNGWEVRVHGLEATMVDVLVRIQLADGRVVSRMLRPDAPSFTFSPEVAGPAAGGYFVLGVEHILLGIDHLLFVLALVWIVRGVGLLVKTITAFTVAHSITLGLATLGVVNVPSAPVEAVIALSIVFVAAEILRLGPRPVPGHSASDDKGAVEQDSSAAPAVVAAATGDRSRSAPSLTARAPWLVAGVFGLLHGFGFAGALNEVGLPANDIPLALLWFNVGVEAGQLVFVAAVLGLLAAGRQVVRLLNPSMLNPQLSTTLRLLPPYAIGSVAMLWVIERTLAIW